MDVSGKLCENENVTELCEPCTVQYLSNQADGFCKDCDEFMCQKCFRDHLKRKYCRNHVLDKLSGAQLQRKLRAREEKCKTHTRESVNYYCSFHDFIGCGDCIISKHRKCEPEFIRDLAMNLEDSSVFKSMISQLQKSDVEKAESESRIARYRKGNKVLVAKAIREIKEFRRDIDCWLDKMETNIEAEVRQISDNNEETFSQLQKMIVDVSDDIDRINKLLDTNIHHGENLFIRMIECKHEVRLIDKTLSEIKSKFVVHVYKFKQVNDMKEILKSLDKLGSIKVVNKTGNKQCNEQPTEDANSPSLANGSCITTESEPGNVCVGETSNVNEFEAQDTMLSRERENYIVVTKKRDQMILLLKQREQEISSLKDLNTSLNSQLDSRNKEYGLLESKSIARQDQDHNAIDSLQSELKKTREVLN